MIYDALPILSSLSRGVNNRAIKNPVNTVSIPNRGRISSSLSGLRPHIVQRRMTGSRVERLRFISVFAVLPGLTSLPLRIAPAKNGMIIKPQKKINLRR